MAQHPLRPTRVPALRPLLRLRRRCQSPPLLPLPPLLLRKSRLPQRCATGAAPPLRLHAAEAVRQLLPPLLTTTETRSHRRTSLPRSRPPSAKLSTRARLPRMRRPKEAACRRWATSSRG